MNPSKIKVVSYVSLGVFAVAALALAWFLYCAMSERTEAEQALAEETDAFRRYNDAAVFPSKKSIEDVKANATSLATWHDSALALAARGDRVFQKETSAGFKQRLQKEVRSLVSLPGGTNGMIAKPDFFFGFDQYLGESNEMPREEELERLAVQLDAIQRVTHIMSEAGVLEITEIKRIAPPKEDERTARAKSRAKPKKAKVDADGEAKVTSLDYAFAFTTRPEGFVKTLNALTGDERFFVVKDLAFRSSADRISDKLNAVQLAAQKAAQPQSGGRRRRSAGRGRRRAHEGGQACRGSGGRCADLGDVHLDGA